MFISLLKSVCKEYINLCTTLPVTITSRTIITSPTAHTADLSSISGHDRSTLGGKM